MTGNIIVVVDANPKRFPPAHDLLRMGVSLREAAKWKRVRREMTSGLKRKVREAVN